MVFFPPALFSEAKGRGGRKESRENLMDRALIFERFFSALFGFGKTISDLFYHGQFFFVRLTESVDVIIGIVLID